MTDADTLPLTRIETERLRWREYQDAIAAADMVLIEHRAAVDHVKACSRLWLEAFRALDQEAA